jgi:hypothetical protein
MQKMRANVFHGPNDIRVEEVPRPSAGAGEAVIRITLTMEPIAFCTANTGKAGLASPNQRSDEERRQVARKRSVGRLAITPWSNIGRLSAQWSQQGTESKR